MSYIDGIICNFTKNADYPANIGLIFIETDEH